MTVVVMFSCIMQLCVELTCWCTDCVITHDFSHHTCHIQVYVHACYIDTASYSNILNNVTENHACNLLGEQTLCEFTFCRTTASLHEIIVN